MFKFNREKLDLLNKKQITEEKVENRTSLEVHIIVHENVYFKNFSNSENSLRSIGEIVGQELSVIFKVKNRKGESVGVIPIS